MELCAASTLERILRELAEGSSVMEIEDGLIKRNSDYWDWKSFLTGIGVE